MDWFLKLSSEVQIPIVGLAMAVVAIIGVIVRARFVRDPGRERDFKPRPIEVRLSEADRELLKGHREAIGDHGEEIGKLREEMIRQSGGTPRRRALPPSN